MSINYYRYAIIFLVTLFCYGFCCGCHQEKLKIDIEDDFNDESITHDGDLGHLPYRISHIE